MDYYFIMHADIGVVESRLREEIICSQMKELDIALENIPVNTDLTACVREKGEQ
mgnify:CR=1 FL=1